LLRGILPIVSSGYFSLKYSILLIDLLSMIVPECK
jgi:hypothetical protein